MAKYAALLRGVNVGGNNRLRMDELRQRFTELGFSKVLTYKQSGNVVFNSHLRGIPTIRKKIEADLKKVLGKEIKVAICSITDLQKIVRLNPFHEVKSSETLAFVSFLLAVPQLKPALPIQTPTGEVEIIDLKHGTAFCLVHRKKGKYTDPNKLLQSALGVGGTVRNWNTVCALAEMA
jgi:uncharacterized protein (DUF1697 family)